MLRALLDDPDLRLHGRLNFGGSRWWRPAGLVFAIAVVWLATSYWRTARGVAARFLPGGTLVLATMVASLFFVLILLAPFQAVARLMEWQNSGKLDLMRLSGRDPLRILAMAFLGSSWSAALVLSVTLGLSLATGPRWREAVLGTGGALLFFLLGSTAAALSRFAQSPDSRTPTAHIGISALLFLCIVPFFLAQAMPSIWTFLGTASAFYTVAIAASLPIAARRIRLGASQGLARDASRFRAGRLTQFLPEAFPAELRRALAFTLGQPIARWSILVAVLLALGIASGDPLHDARARPGAGGFDPSLLAAFLRQLTGNLPQAGFVRAMRAYVRLLCGGGLLVAGVLMTAEFARREVRSGAIELVRLTRQSAVSIVAGWIVGAALPFWLVAFPLLVYGSLAANVGKPPLEALQPFLVIVGTAVFAGGLALLEALERKPTASYFVLAAIAAAALAVAPSLANPSFQWWGTLAWAVARWRAWQQAAAFLLTPVVCAGMAASRFAPSHRARLAGTWGVAGVAWISTLSALNEPRSFSLPAYLALAGSLFGDPASASRISRRLLLPAVCAFLLAITTSRVWRFDPVTRRGYDSPADLGFLAAAAALAVMLGILVHETCGRLRGASPAVRFALVFLIAVFCQPGVPQVAVLATGTALFAGIQRWLRLRQPAGPQPV